MKQNPKTEIVKIDRITFVPEESQDAAFKAWRNYRQGDNYDLPQMIDDIAYRGQLTDLELEEVDGKIFILRGNRRFCAIKFLSESVDPRTQNPYIDPTTNKPFVSVRAKIYRNLTASERVSLKFDHGTEKSLNPLEMFYAVCDCLDVGMNDLDTVTQARGLFAKHYPPNHKIDDTPKAYLEYWKGAYQVMKWAWSAPTVLRLAYEAKLRGQTKWPTKKELLEMLKTYEAEQAADSSNKITRDNPGPQFLEHFNRIADEKKNAEITGEKSKPMSMLNRAQLLELKKLTDSIIFKCFIDFILQAKPKERLSTLITLQKGLEAKMTTEEKNLFDVVVGTDPVVVETTTKELQPA